MPPQNPPQQPTIRPANSPHSIGIAICVLAICLLFVVGLFFFRYAKHVESEIVVTPIATTTTPITIDAFEGVSLEAEAAYVFDVRNGKALFAKNSTLPLPLASLTKLLTALTAMTHLSPDTIVTISSDALSTNGESGLTTGEQWGLSELVSFMLITSSNDAAAALRETYETETGGSFITAMNTEAARIGLIRSSFRNATGLDIGDGASNTGSAEDVARLFAAVLARISEELDATRYESASFTSRSGTVHRVESTNMLANNIPWSLGAKTGFTDAAGGNLAISFDASIGHPIVIVVIGSSKEGRFSDVEELIARSLIAIQGVEIGLP